MTESKKTAGGHHSTFLERMAWGAGGMTEGLSQSIFTFAFSIFGIGLGVSPFLIGIAKGLPRLVDGITDPFMGNISDNTHTRWGRRRPFIFIGAILIGLIYPVIWLPNRTWPEMGLFAWLTGMTIVFFVAYTIWNIPWSAMGLELSDDYNDRTRIQVFRMIFATLAGVGVSWSYKLCFVINPDEVIGVRSVGWLIGLILMSTGIVSSFFVKEWRSLDKQKPIRLGPALKMTLSDKPFLLLCATVLLFASGFMLVDPMLLYVNIYYVFEGNRESASTIMGLCGTAGVLLSLVIIPLGGRLSEKIGKRQTALIALGCIIIGRGSLFWAAAPANPYLQLVSRMLYHPGNMLMWALIPSMIADVCDLDELESGRRREAMFSAVYQWIWKCGATLAMILSGALLSLVGAKVNTPNMILAPQVVLNMRLIMAVVPTVLGILAFLCLWFFPLSEKRLEEAKKEMARRKELLVS